MLLILRIAVLLFQHFVVLEIEACFVRVIQGMAGAL